MSLAQKIQDQQYSHKEARIKRYTAEMVSTLKKKIEIRASNRVYEFIYSPPMMLYNLPIFDRSIVFKEVENYFSSDNPTGHFGKISKKRWDKIVVKALPHEAGFMVRITPKPKKDLCQEELRKRIINKIDEVVRRGMRETCTSFTVPLMIPGIPMYDTHSELTKIKEYLETEGFEVLVNSGGGDDRKIVISWANNCEKNNLGESNIRYVKKKLRSRDKKLADVPKKSTKKSKRKRKRPQKVQNEIEHSYNYKGNTCRIFPANMFDPPVSWTNQYSSRPKGVLWHYGGSKYSEISRDVQRGGDGGYRGVSSGFSGSDLISSHLDEMIRKGLV